MFLISHEKSGVSMMDTPLFFLIGGSPDNQLGISSVCYDCCPIEVTV
jgi:hypothetical protein